MCVQDRAIKLYPDGVSGPATPSLACCFSAFCSFSECLANPVSFFFFFFFFFVGVGVFSFCYVIVIINASFSVIHMVIGCRLVLLDL